ATPQLSLTVGLPRLTLVAAHRPLLAVTVLRGGQLMFGGWVSVTMTVWTQVAVLPLTSRTVQVTKLVPTGKLAGALLVMLATPQLSLTVGVPRLTFVAAHRPLLAVTLTKAGQVMLGGWVSVTMTVWTQVEVLPLTSRTVQVTKLVPTGKLAGALLA